MIPKTYIDDVKSLVTFDMNTLGPKLILPALTLLGAWGGFPAPPKSFNFLAQNTFFQYFFLWVLVMQGGASADPDLSLVAVLVFVGFAELIKFIERRSLEKED